MTTKEFAKALEEGEEFFYQRHSYKVIAKNKSGVEALSTNGFGPARVIENNELVWVLNKEAVNV